MDRLLSPLRLLWPLFLLCHWLAAGLLAWHLLAQVNFAYPLAYQTLAIDEHIAHYGPANRYRDHFAETDTPQRLTLFGRINHAIHHNPEQLAVITYMPPGRQPIALLHHDEVVHLQDVARLVQKMYWLGYAATGLGLITGLILWCRRQMFPRASRVAVGVIAGLALIGVSVLAIGAKTVFYTLHTWIFPPDHPWFFFYQDSLMTTLMKAPDLFGFIAVLLLALWLTLWGVSLWVMVRLWPAGRH